MGKSKESLEATLEQILRDVKKGEFPDWPALVVNVPEDLREEDLGSVSFSKSEADTLKMATEILGRDLRFEYLKDGQARDLIQRFAIRAFTKDKQSVAQFVAEHAHEIKRLDCHMDIEHLAVATELEIANVRFVPPDQAPAPRLFNRPVGVQGVAVVACEGTNYSKMTERARETAAGGVRLLRAALREHNFIPENQLRFKLGEHAWFDDSQAGWKRHPDDPFELELDAALAEFVESQSISSLPAVPSNDVERRLHRSLLWLDKAQLEMDPTTRLLFGFFALETILGDRSEGKKALGIAYRRAMLGAAVSEHFTAPDRTFYLYESVRSAAVHGEGNLLVTEKEARIFLWDVRRAIREYATFALREGLTKRKQIRKALENHSDRPKMEELLLSENSKRWKRYLSNGKA
jgi:hypothetical protein